MLYVHSGTAGVTDHVRRLFEDLEAEVNDSGELLRTRVFKQADLHAMVSGEVEGDRIDLEIALFEWGPDLRAFRSFLWSSCCFGHWCLVAGARRKLALTQSPQVHPPVRGE